MLKNGTPFDQNCFKELLHRDQSIRASERQIYQQIADIFAECSIDYDVQNSSTRQFYAMFQNKFHYAIIDKTMAEIIFDPADRNKPRMGLQTWKTVPHGRIHKVDITITKNYIHALSIFFNLFSSIYFHKSQQNLGSAGF